MILITGGNRSGKSVFAENLAKKTGQRVLYLATAVPFDQDMVHRIQIHQQRRPAHWETYEGYLHLDRVIQEKKNQFPCMLLDCLTVWITNLLFYFAQEEDPEKFPYSYLEEQILREAEKIIQAASDSSFQLIAVTNEVGMGILPANTLGRHFCDIAGRVNQMFANASQEVYAVLSGIPVRIK